MSRTATSIYEFCAQNSAIDLVRIEVASPAFATFRRCVRNLIDILREDPVSLSAAELIQYSLLQWLSVPMPFEDYDLAPIRALGSPGAIGNRWGSGARAIFIEASEAFTELRAGENPLRVAVEREILDAATSGGTLKIYCHRTARAHFESLPAWTELRELAQIEFLGSARDYRTTATFDSMLKVGPLRDRGFSSMPGAVLNAPRYRRLIQVAWHGTPDQPRFGSDPVLRTWRDQYDEANTAVWDGSGEDGAVTVRRTSTILGDTMTRQSIDASVVDDFAPGARHSGAAESRRAVLLYLSDQLGCLQAPHADIICVGGDSSDGHVARMEPREIDARFTHLVDPALEHVDFGVVRASEGRYATRWKEQIEKGNKISKK